MDKGDSITTSTPAASSAVAQSQEAAAPAPKRSRVNCEGLGERFSLSPGFNRSADSSRSYHRKNGDPIYRPLKIYTIDPVRGRLEGAVATINVPYEPLRKGPQGARFEVVADEKGPFGAYDAVDLEDRRVLIRSGREPCPSDPVFHHQMVYAVASSTYAAFRSALGREIVWNFAGPRLKLVPHAVKDRRAFYSPTDRVIAFGWYDAGTEVIGRVPPNGRVFLCLSHDVVAHEVTHAILDGLRGQFNVKLHKDVPAFHEAFADLIALLQRFSYTEVVRQAIARTGGEFHTDPSFLRFGFQFAQSQNRRVEREPDFSDKPQRYDPALGEYELGTILVSAILEALVTVYQRKAMPFRRLATQGTGLFAPGAALPEDLVDTLTHIATRLASHFLSICIRAIDYCPPVGLDLGEYLRALVTADFALVPDDPWAYREALIDAFTRRGIYPRKVASLSEDALLWRHPDRPMIERRLNFARLRFAGDPASPAGPDEVRRQGCILGQLVTKAENLDEFGLAAPDDPELKGDRVHLPLVESVRSSRRIGPDGQVIFDLIAEVTQQRTVAGGGGQPEMEFYGGSTIIFGPDGDVRYVISKSIKDESQIQRLREYTLESQNVEDVSP